MVWAATWSTMAWLRAPAYCAVSVAPATARPPPSAIIRKVTGKLTDTAATAAAPRRPTQKASVIWYPVCSRFARTMGTASLSKARRTEGSEGSVAKVMQSDGFRTEGMMQRDLRRGCLAPAHDMTVPGRIVAGVDVI